MSVKADAKIVVSADDKATGALQAITQKVQGMIAPLDSLKTKLSGGLGGQAFGELGQRLGNLKGQLSALGLVGGAGIAVGGIAAVKSAFDSVVATAEKADRISDLGGRLRLSAEQFQVFEKFAKDGGSSIEEVGGAFMKFRLNINQALSEGGPKLAKLSKTLAHFGMTAKDAQSMDQMELMKRIGKTWSEAGTDADEALKLMDARELFGKVGATVIPVIEQIGTEYDKTLRGMRESGLIITDEMAKVGGDAFKAYDKSKGSMKGLQFAFGIEMMPVFEQFSNIMNDRMKANRTAMMPGVRALAKTLSQSLKPFLDDMDKVAEKTSGAFKWINKLAGLVGWDKVVFGGLLLIASPFIAALGGVAVAAWSAAAGIAGMVAASAKTGAIATLIGGLKSVVTVFQLLGFTGAKAWLMAMGPISLLVGAVVGAAYLIYSNWGGIVAFFGGVWDGIVSGLGPVADAFSSISRWVKPVWDTVSGFFGDLFDDTKEGEKSWASWANAGKVAGELISGVLKALLLPFALVTDAVQGLTAAWDWFKGNDVKFDSAVAKLAGGAPSAAPAVPPAIAGAPAKGGRQALQSGVSLQSSIADRLPPVASVNQQFNGRMVVELDKNLIPKQVQTDNQNVTIDALAGAMV